MVIALTTVLVGAVGLLASALAARGVLRINPAQALRDE
jgi:ABC-type antimicrobial peptide transport system permease subunit